MKLYIDSAVHTEWKLPPGCPKPQGVTTNPTLVLRAGLPVSLPSYLRLLAQAGDPTLTWTRAWSGWTRCKRVRRAPVCI